MANIKRYGEGVGFGIEAYKESEPYYYGIDNRPIKNLTDNDIKINQELESLFFKKPVESPNGINKIFTLPNQEILANNSLSVFLNGIKYRNENIKILNNGRKFEIINGDLIPLPIDNFEIKYRAYKPDASQTNFDILSPNSEGLNQIITQKQPLNIGDTNVIFGSLNYISIENLTVYLMDETNSPAIIKENFVNSLNGNIINLTGDQGSTGTYDLNSQTISITFGQSIGANYFVYVIKSIEDI